MGNNRRNDSRLWRRVLSVLLALSMCFALAVSTLAADTDGSAGTTEAATQPQDNADRDTEGKGESESKEDSTEPTTEATEPTEPATEATEPVPAVDPAEFKAAWEAFCAMVDPDAWAEHENLKKAVEAELSSKEAQAPLYLRTDVLAALKEAVRLAQEQDKLNQEYAQVTALIHSSTLAQEQKDSYLAAIALKLAELAADPALEVLQALSSLTGAPIATPVADELAGKQADLAVAFTGFRKALENQSLWPEIDGQLVRLEEFVQEKADSRTIMAEELARLKAERTKLQDQFASFFAQTAADQASLAANIETLARDADNYHMSLIRDLEARIDSLKEELNQLLGRISTLSLELKAVQGKLVVSYVALAVAALGVIMALVATVFGVKKPAAPELDASALATREALETVDKQNKMLKQALNTLHQKQESMAQEISALREELTSRPVAVQETAVTREPEIIPVQEPEKPVIQERGRMELHYQVVNPGNSYLGVKDDGKYILYVDGSLGIAQQKRLANELKGWTSTGLFYLFTPEINGKQMDAYNTELPMGYYSVKEVVRPAMVQEQYNGYFVLTEKGVVRMEKRG